MRLAAFNGPSPKIPIQMQKSRKYLIHRSSFVPNFVPWQRVSIGKNAVCSTQWPILKTPRYRRKNRADIFCTSRGIVNFVSNFVGMATGVGQRKCNWQHSMAHSRNTPLQAQVQKSPTQAELQPILSQISLPWQPGRVRGKIK